MAPQDDLHLPIDPSLPHPVATNQIPSAVHERTRRWRRQGLVAVGGLLGAVLIVGGLMLLQAGGRLAGAGDPVGTSLCAAPGGVERTSSSASSDPSAGLSLHLSATTVTAGEVITRTVSGGTFPGTITSAAMTLQQCVNGSWQTIYYLNLSTTNPQTVAGSNLPVIAIGLGPGPLEARIPPVPAGTYRICQDASTDTSTSTPKGNITLYALITITGS